MSQVSVNLQQQIVETRINSLTRQNLLLQKENDNLKSQVSTRDEQLNQIHNEIEKIRADIEKNRIDSNTLASLQCDNYQLTSQIAELNKTIHELQNRAVEVPKITVDSTNTNLQELLSLYQKVVPSRDLVQNVFQLFNLEPLSPQQIQEERINVQIEELKLMDLQKEPEYINQPINQVPTIQVLNQQINQPTQPQVTQSALNQSSNNVNQPHQAQPPLNQSNITNQVTQITKSPNPEKQKKILKEQKEQLFTETLRKTLKTVTKNDVSELSPKQICVEVNKLDKTFWKEVGEFNDAQEYYRQKYLRNLYDEKLSENDKTVIDKYFQERQDMKIYALTKEIMQKHFQGRNVFENDVTDRLNQNKQALKRK
ncbi:Hypothetical_protein [Hexamita inflata]|uniref:Hypothetical_protein n=1 Tax=Hexamita inflata TaxID=28002 RepID=A0AA86RA14_9EUKA|nr:Hypothetical protein HINF_LOCUS21481 [Hexamita inflata]CAI9973515.1 Hypothetical protein HINF_LOCUS61160 [Hexamita inflata]